MHHVHLRDTLKHAYHISDTCIMIKTAEKFSKLHKAAITFINDIHIHVGNKIKTLFSLFIV